MFVRRFLALVTVVSAINLCWHFYRAWMPKMLREHYEYDRGFVNYFTSAFYIATDVGCLAAGVATRLLAARGWAVHRARVVTFLACALLTALGVLVAVLPAGPALLATLLVIAAGALGLFPIYYSLMQELSAQRQGRVAGALAAIAWVVTAFMHEHVGHWLDRTGSYGAALVVLSLLPLGAIGVVMMFWDR
jgi:ACS family hexuronate transporter-like MFS transporter